MNKNIDIKHLVIPGGGPSGMQAIGILQRLETRGVWSRPNIQSIFATSAGTLVAILIALNFEWDVINDYLVKRPWDKFVGIDLALIVASFQRKGIFDIALIKNFFRPFFLARDIDLDITFQAFYELTNIKLYFYTFELTEFEAVELSVDSHPNLSLLQAVYMSSAIPLLFEPVISEGKCFVDGGFCCNNPLSFCMQKAANNKQIEVFCISHDYGDSNDGGTHNHHITSPTLNFAEYIFYLLLTVVMRIGGLLRRIIASEATGAQNYAELKYKARRLNLEDINRMVYSQEERRAFIDFGIAEADRWCEDNFFD